MAGTPRAPRSPPSAASATCHGPSRTAAAAGPPSPLKRSTTSSPGSVSRRPPVPATVVMTPSELTRRTRSLPVSAMESASSAPARALSGRSASSGGWRRRPAASARAAAWPGAASAAARRRPRPARAELLEPPVADVGDVDVAPRVDRHPAHVGELARAAAGAAPLGQVGAARRRRPAPGAGCSRWRPPGPPHPPPGAAAANSPGRAPGRPTPRQRLSAVIEHLDAVVAAVGDVDPVLAVDRHRHRRAERAGPLARAPPGASRAPLAS